MKKRKDCDGLEREVTFILEEETQKNKSHGESCRKKLALIKERVDLVVGDSTARVHCGPFIKEVRKEDWLAL